MSKLTNEQIISNKIEFLNLLKTINRPGLDSLIDWLENKSDFFTAPSSMNYHGNYNGGLCQHSLNVYRALVKFINNSDMLALKQNELDKIPAESLIIVSLLHDICKANFYQEDIKFYKDSSTNQWIQYKTYKCNDTFPIGHGEKSVIMIQNFIKLTGSEILSIRWHMGLFEPGTIISQYLNPAYNKATDECPLAAMLQMADFYASHMMEYNIDQRTENKI